LTELAVLVGQHGIDRVADLVAAAGQNVIADRVALAADGDALGCEHRALGGVVRRERNRGEVDLCGHGGRTGQTKGRRRQKHTLPIRIHMTSVNPSSSDEWTIGL
jgi:hypothetical protein